MTPTQTVLVQALINLNLKASTADLAAVTNISPATIKRNLSTLPGVKRVGSGRFTRWTLTNAQTIGAAERNEPVTKGELNDLKVAALMNASLLKQVAVGIQRIHQTLLDIRQHMVYTHAPTQSMSIKEKKERESSSDQLQLIDDPSPFEEPNKTSDLKRSLPGTWWWAEGWNLEQWSTLKHVVDQFCLLGNNPTHAELHKVFGTNMTTAILLLSYSEGTLGGILEKMRGRTIADPQGYLLSSVHNLPHDLDHEVLLGRLGVYEDQPVEWTISGGRLLTYAQGTPGT